MCISFPLRPEASFLKGQGHQGIFSLVKGTWGTCKFLLGRFKGTNAKTKGHEAVTFVASVKYQTWDLLFKRMSSFQHWRNQKGGAGCPPPPHRGHKWIAAFREIMFITWTCCFIVCEESRTQPCEVNVGISTVLPGSPQVSCLWNCTSQRVGTSLISS